MQINTVKCGKCGSTEHEIKDCNKSGIKCEHCHRLSRVTRNSFFKEGRFQLYQPLSHANDICKSITDIIYFSLIHVNYELQFAGRVLEGRKKHNLDSGSYELIIGSVC